MDDKSNGTGDKSESQDRTGIWMGVAMCVGTAVLMLIGWLGRGSVTL